MICHVFKRTFNIFPWLTNDFLSNEMIVTCESWAVRSRVLISLYVFVHISGSRYIKSMIFVVDISRVMEYYEMTTKFNFHFIGDLFRISNQRISGYSHFDMVKNVLLGVKFYPHMYY